MSTGSIQRNPNTEGILTSSDPRAMDNSAIHPDPPESGCLNWMARCLASRNTQYLAGAGLTGGVIALVLLGPVAIPVIIISVSLGLLGLSAATVLTIKDPKVSNEPTSQPSLINVFWEEFIPFFMLMLSCIACGLGYALSASRDTDGATS